METQTLEEMLSAMQTEINNANQQLAQLLQLQQEMIGYMEKQNKIIKSLRADKKQLKAKLS